MIFYKNLNGNSGIEAFEIGEKHILVQFSGGSIYKYTYQSTGEEQLEKMKSLAVQGKGLSTYISQNVKNNFAEKLR